MKYTNTAVDTEYDNDGLMTKGEADVFVDWFNNTYNPPVGDEWRLPNTPITADATCSQPFNEGYDCTQSELGHLYYTELGNSSGEGGLTNRGFFRDIEIDLNYWTNWDFTSPGAPDESITFKFRTGLQTRSDNIDTHYVWLVHDGDVANPPSQCSDAMDNDGDGLIDYPEDPECACLEDQTESDAPILCATSRRSMTGEPPKSLSIEFTASEDDTCRLTKVVINVGSGNTLARTSGWTCMPTSHTWSGENTNQVTITLNPPLNPGESFSQCISDSLGFYWDSGQTITATFTCSTGQHQSTAIYDYFYDVTTYKTYKLSQATVGSCPPPDADNDGREDICDNCPDTPNYDQADSEQTQMTMVKVMSVKHNAVME
jgi:hypothetical protein